MKLFLIYLGIGIAVYYALLRSFRRRHLDGSGLKALWLWWLTSGEPLALLLGPLLWPIALLLTILEYWHLKSKRQEAVEKEAAQKAVNKYSNLSMDELLAAQKKAMGESNLQPKENHAN
jgi:membrane protein insertase Oxa1/YidC/SpoIIIJ